MAKFVDVTLPAFEDGTNEAEIGRWVFKEGEKVTKGTLIVDILVAKVEHEILAEVDGMLVDIQKGDGEIVEVGELLCRIQVE